MEYHLDASQLAELDADTLAAIVEDVFNAWDELGAQPTLEDAKQSKSEQPN